VQSSVSLSAYYAFPALSAWLAGHSSVSPSAYYAFPALSDWLPVQFSVSLSAYYAFPALSAWLPVQSSVSLSAYYASQLCLLGCLCNLLFLFLSTMLYLLCLLTLFGR
jgi:hypothetical protein